jgi:hypothetical protein
MAAPAWAWRPGRARPCGGTPASSGTPNSPPLRRGGRRQRVCGPTPTAEQRGGDASPVAPRSREVAGFIVTDAPRGLCIISAKLNNQWVGVSVS